MTLKISRTKALTDDVLKFEHDLLSRKNRDVFPRLEGARCRVDCALFISSRVAHGTRVTTSFVALEEIRLRPLYGILHVLYRIVQVDPFVRLRVDELTVDKEFRRALVHNESIGACEK